MVSCPEHRALNLRAARESIVLLRNDGTLPLAADALHVLAVVGPTPGRSTSARHNCPPAQSSSHAPRVMSYSGSHWLAV